MCSLGFCSKVGFIKRLQHLTQTADVLFGSCLPANWLKLQVGLRPTFNLQEPNRVIGTDLINLLERGTMFPGDLKFFRHFLPSFLHDFFFIYIFVTDGTKTPGALNQ